VRSISDASADLIELGVPFSDPLADGPTIQPSMQGALENKASQAPCFAAVRDLRQSGISHLLILMGYYNPILSYGIERFVVDASTSGLDDLIVPDLPPDEAGESKAACE
jgi:tryptophan synthase alpha chain